MVDWKEVFEKRGPWSPVATDAIIFNEQKKEIVLIKRKNPPYLECWCLPGGFHELGETLEQTAVREAYEETGILTEVRSLIGVYSDPDRDPRHQLISVCYCLEPIDDDYCLKAGDDAKEAEWFKLDDLSKIKLGFDHSEMIHDFRLQTGF